MTEQATVSAVILAAGGSTRMGVPKQFLPLKDKPVLMYSLLAFQACDKIFEIVVVARQEDIAKIQELANEQQITKLKQVVVGGATRKDSAQRGAKVCSEASNFIAVHDGARPLITPEMIKRVVAIAEEHGAAAAAVPTKDTIKQVDSNGFVINTPARETLWNVQTPQIFEKKLYIKAIEYCEKICEEITDDCQMVERMGHPVKLVEGSYSNIKITTPEDIKIAEGWL